MELRHAAWSKSAPWVAAQLSSEPWTAPRWAALLGDAFMAALSKASHYGRNNNVMMNVNTLQGPYIATGPQGGHAPLQNMARNSLIRHYLPTRVH